MRSQKHSAPVKAISAVNALLALWLILVVSPWLSGALTEDARTWSYVVAGSVISVLEVLSLTVTGIRHPGLGKAA